MNLKKLGAALVVVLLLSAVVVSSASAAAVAEAATWRTGSAGTVLSGSETETATGKGELVTAVGETPLVLKSTGLECLECTIKNEEGKATGTGKLRLTGVTVSSPAACAVNGGAITTVVIVFAHYYMNGVLWETRISVLSGATLATVSLVKGSGACPIAGTYNLTGNLFTRATNATGVYAAGQTATSSGAINKEAGGELKFGSKAAELNGTATYALSGPKSGELFGVHK
jgi:hypothetical protein